MKLGIGSYTFGWRARLSNMTPFEVLDEAEDLGVTVIQIADNMPLDVLTRDELGHLGGEAARRGITVETGTRGIRPDHLRRFLDIADLLQAPLLRVVADTADEHPGPAEIVDRLSRVVPDFEAAGVTLAVENHDRFPAAMLRRVMEELRSRHAGICLDTANSIGAHEGIEHVAETLAPWVANVHVKDITIRRLRHQMGFHVEGAPAGTGDLDIPALLERVRRRVPRDVNVILEQWTPPEDGEAETVAKERRWAQESVAYLRTLIPD